MTREAQAGVAGGRCTFVDFQPVIACGTIAWFGLTLLLAGCASGPVALTPQQPTTTSPTTQFGTPPAFPSASPTAQLPIASNRSITLTVWVPETFAPEAPGSGQVLERQIDEFAQGHPGIAVDVSIKNEYGKGGLLDFMLKVQSLVPERLPDLVVLDSREADAAAKNDLVQPLDQDMPSGAFADLLPPAQQLARYDGRWLFLPLTLDLQQLAYNTRQVKTAPGTWDQLLASGASFAFPADDDDAFLFQYLENHGRLASARQPVPLDISTVNNVLTFFQRARSANLVPDAVLGVKSAREAWQLFAEGQVALAQVSATDFLAGRDRVPGAAFAPVPTQDGAAATLVSSWNYAIVTQDPRRHAAAAEFLNWISEPARVAAWAEAGHAIPARRSAFVQAVAPAEYADFLLKLATVSLVPPTFAERAPYTAAWHAALQSVLRGQATPGEAALKAASSAAP